MRPLAFLVCSFSLVALSCLKKRPSADVQSTLLNDAKTVKVAKPTMLKDVPLPSTSEEVHVKCNVPEGATLKGARGPFRTISNHLRFDKVSVVSASGEVLCPEFTNTTAYAFAPHLTIPPEVPGKIVFAKFDTFFKKDTDRAQEMNNDKRCAIAKGTAVNIDPDFGKNGIAEFKDGHARVKVLDGFPCELNEGWLFAAHFTDGLSMQTTTQERYASLAGNENGVSWPPCRTTASMIMALRSEDVPAI